MLSFQYTESGLVPTYADLISLGKKIFIDAFNISQKKV